MCQFECLLTNTCKNIILVHFLSNVSACCVCFLFFSVSNLKNDSSNDRRHRRRESISQSQKPGLPIAVVQIINKKDDMENGYFTKKDEELLDLLLRFVAPIVANSQLFKKKTKKSKRKEGDVMKDLTHSYRPSRELKKQLSGVIMNPITE